MGLALELALTDGFATREVKIRALAEFAKIGGQGWAIRMLRELGAISDD